MKLLFPGRYIAGLKQPVSGEVFTLSFKCEEVLLFSNQAQL